MECISGTREREGRTVVVRVEHGRTEHVARVVRAEAQAAAHVHALVQRDRSDLAWVRGLGLGVKARARARARARVGLVTFRMHAVMSSEVYRFGSPLLSVIRWRKSSSRLGQMAAVGAVM